MNPLLFFFLLASPFLMMWWMVAARNRVRNRLREAEGEEEAPAFEVPYTDTFRSADGLNYSRSLSVNEELLTATRKAGEPDGIKALQGRR